MDDLHEMRRLRDYVPEPSRDELDEQWQRIAAEVVDAPVRPKRRCNPRLPPADLDPGRRCRPDRRARPERHPAPRHHTDHERSTGGGRGDRVHAFARRYGRA